MKEKTKGNLAIIGLISLILSVLLLSGCQEMFDERISELKAKEVCDNLQAGENDTLVYYPPFREKAVELTEGINNGRFNLLESEMSTFSYDTNETICRATLEVCVEKEDFDLCLDYKIYFTTMSDEWDRWSEGKELFN